MVTPAERVQAQALSDSGAVPPGYVLGFNDEFNGTSLDTAVWNYRTDVKGYSAQRPENITVASGTMRINLRAESYGGKGFTGGGVISRQKLDHGYYEIRARLTAAPGWHTSFWSMNGSGATTGGSQRVIEVDGFETDSVSRYKFAYGIWQWNVSPPTHTECGAYSTPFDPAADFHVYGYEWTDTVTRYFVDGKLVCTQTYLASEHDHAPANLWLTSIGYKDPGPSASTLPADIQFDYARYYTRDPNYSAGSTLTVNNGEPGYAEAGSGWTSSALAGYQASYTRFSTASSASATWTPTVATTGQYTVSYYNVQGTGANLSPSATFTVAHAGGSSTVVKNLQSAPAGWVDLGVFDLNAGSANSVKLVASGGKTLRANAVRFEPVAAAKTTVMIDNGDTGYAETGTWLTSALTGQGGTSTRYSGTPGATATWTPTLPAGTYAVSIYRVSNPGSDTNAQVDVSANGTTGSQGLNLGTGSSGWVSLGTFTFSGAGGEFVRIRRGNSWVRADAVRFEQQ
jgi:beta-glucanase (GH16 family)